MRWSTDEGSGSLSFLRFAISQQMASVAMTSSALTTISAMLSVDSEKPPSLGGAAVAVLARDEDDDDRHDGKEVEEERRGGGQLAAAAAAAASAQDGHVDHGDDAVLHGLCCRTG